MTRARLASIATACAALCGAAFPGPAQAADLAPQVWINPGMYSYHFDRDADYREDNTGFGVEVLLTDDHALMAGSFINSDRQRSHYGLYEWRPLHWPLWGVKLSAGLGVGVWDGYPKYRDGAWFAAALPLLSVEGERLGVNLAFVPTIANRMSGALSIQLKLRLW